VGENIAIKYNRMKDWKLKQERLEVFKIKIGDYLLSHTPAHAVPSAYRGLTSLFGMGRGVTPWL
jgi:hypothetical protein